MQIQLLDAKSLRRLVNAFSKRYQENMELRLKYVDEPEKFLESEVDLDEHIKGLMQVRVRRQRACGRGGRCERWTWMSTSRALCRCEQ